jgi:hypothetical protein
MLQSKEFDALAACREVIDDVERRYTKDVCPPITLVRKQEVSRENENKVMGDKERFKQVMKLARTGVGVTRWPANT